MSFVNLRCDNEGNLKYCEKNKGLYGQKNPPTPDIMQTIVQDFTDKEKAMRKRFGLPGDELIQNRMPKGIPLSIARRNWQMLASKSPTSQKPLILPFWVRSGARILCDVCKSKDAMFACRCMTRFYCSLRHQVQDWNDNEHWGVCPWTLQTDPDWWRMVKRVYTHDKRFKGDTAHKNIKFPLTGRPMVHLNDYPRSPSAPEMPQKGHFYLPALRYAQHSYSLEGRDDLQETEFCGKFFFFEQNSAVLIDLGNVRIFPSKLAAALSLMPYMSEEDRKHVAPVHPALDLPVYVKSIDRMYGDLPNYRHANPNVLKAWAKEYLRVVHLTLVQSPDNIPTVDDPIIKDKEIGTKSPLYPNYMGPLYDNGTLDYCDQPVCHAAKRAGIDTIIFQHEGGQRHSCTEILCVDPDKALERLVPRARTTMLREAIESTPLLAFAPYNINFPHNWFVQDGLYIGADHGAVKRVACSVSEDGRVTILQ